MINCLQDHLVQVGILGQIGRFVSVDAVNYPRGTRVICRTRRGLELGRVLAHTAPVAGRGLADGSLLRRVTVADELLLARLGKRRQEAYLACVRMLDERGIASVLVDVEHLFDGRTLYFYFLGETPPEAESIIAELARAYEAEVKFGQFAEAVEKGCGPGCGTADAPGCQSTCASCAVSGACKLV
jgi:cell fate regulator YaaT (PSP1 superfamily)